MATERMSGKKLPLTIAFTVLLVAAFGAGCKGFFVPPTLTSITINPASPSVQLSSTATLQAFGVNSDGTGSYLTSGVSWSTSDDTIATISGDGSATITGVGLGTATITASAESVTNTATATVYIQISSMSITPASQSIASGGTTTDPYIVHAVTQNGTIDISSSATLTAYTSYPGGTQVTTLSCTYDASGANGAGQYCSDDGTTSAGNYTIVATYTGTTLYATTQLNVQ
jgi:uncharacterized protein YjdB